MARSFVCSNALRELLRAAKGYVAVFRGYCDDDHGMTVGLLAESELALEAAARAFAAADIKDKENQ